MIIVADGGSTKVDWALIEDGKLWKRVFTHGANPFFRTGEDISEELFHKLVPEVEGHRVESVHFFGAGCVGGAKNEIIRDAIHVSLQAGNVEVGSDMLGAAKGLLGDRKGIACILGTGSNSGYYDGKEITENVSPLGFILGDEGSGAVLGRLFVGACLKNQFGKELKAEFLEQTGFQSGDFIEHVYRGKQPNRFLAGFAPFIKQHLSDERIYRMVETSFEDFFRRNVMQYDYENTAICFTGSVAYHFQDVLRSVAHRLHLQLAEIVASPMEGMIAYYSRLNQ